MRALGKALPCVLILVIGISPVASAQSVEIVVHPDTDVNSISRAELSKIFLKRLRTWSDGTLAVPVDQYPESPTRAEFTQRVHMRSVITVEVYWKRMIFSGRSVPPAELANDEEVLEFVQTHPGAVGYVSASASLDGVRRLTLRE